MKFITRLEAGEKMVDLCHEFGISRKTGYKFWNRWKEEGPEGLFDRSRAPFHTPHRRPQAVRDLVFAVKKEHPTWGARKVLARLRRTTPGVKLPADSTVSGWFKQAGLTTRRVRRRGPSPSRTPLTVPTHPNHVWCADFKGQFRMANREYCYPLTITDAFSRKIIACVALEGTHAEPSRLVFQRAFREFGLPENLRTDNGNPFCSSQALFGWSRLSVWWHELGIKHERIEPGKPQQNGQHERMHLTLKKECTRPAGDNLLHQQEKFDAFVTCFNAVRPHEGIDDDVPDDRYSLSERMFPETIVEPDYALYDVALPVRSSGHIEMPARGKRPRTVYVSTVLAGRTVGVRELDDDRWMVAWRGITIGEIDMTTRRLTIPDTDPECHP